MKALIIEDAPEFVLAVAEILKEAEFEVLVAETGHAGLDVAATDQPDMIILDLGLPDLDGIEVCGRLRSITDAYIVIVTARTADVDLAAGFAAGADDYVTKPFSAIELNSRVRAVMRRARRRTDMADALGLSLDPAERSVCFSGKTAELTQTEFRILGRLLLEDGGVVSRETIAETLWGGRWDGVSHTIDVHISNLRKKLRDIGWPGRVATVRGVGLRIEELPAAA